MPTPVNTTEKMSGSTRTTSHFPAYIVNSNHKVSPPGSVSTAKRRSLRVVSIHRRPLMHDHDPALDAAIREIANLLATVHLRLQFPERPAKLDSPETKSDSCDGGLTT